MRSKLHPNIIWLGIASLFNDISGEIVTRVLPIFLSTTLGVGMALIGLIEGIADTTSSVLKLASGWYSDKFKTRKGPTVFGYSLTAVARPLLYWTNSWTLPLLSRFLDRAGKGIRTSPRDALVADSASEQERGRAFGLQRTLDPLGAVIGALIAALIASLLSGDTPMKISGSTFKVLILAASIPSVISVVLIALFVRNIKTPISSAKARASSNHSTSFSSFFKRYLAILFVFSLGMSSDAFILLRAGAEGLRPSEIFLLVALFNLVTVVTAYPSGIIADHFGKRRVLLFGWIFYAVIYVGFAIAETPVIVSILFVLYGLYYGLTEGVEKAFVADLVPEERRGEAYGYFNMIIGLSALPASVGFGAIWQWIGPEAAFGVGAGCAGVASILLLMLVRKT